MNKKIKLFLVLIIVVVIGGGITSYYMFNKPHRNIAKEEIDYQLPANDLINDFLSNESKANEKYLDKVVFVEGVIVDKVLGDANFTIILEDEFEGISATFDSIYVSDNTRTLNEYSMGDKIQIKGRCDGVLMLKGVILNKCVLQ